MRHIFFMVARRSSTSTLFPYTTLFRSAKCICITGTNGKTTTTLLIHHLLKEAGLNVVVVLPDRKSTRLNSSHVAISYAVFCLKKKSSGLICLSRATWSVSELICLLFLL